MHLNNNQYMFYCLKKSTSCHDWKIAERRNVDKVNDLTIIITKKENKYVF